MALIPYYLSRLPYQDSLQILEADIQQANALAAAIPRARGGTLIKMKLEPNDGRSIMSTRGRKATIKDFYAVILPSLQRLYGSFDDKLETCEDGNTCLEGSSCGNKVIEGDGKLTNVDLQREDECGICLEPCTKMVLPNCCHAMNRKSESCPFCRGSLRRVNSEDLWVLTCDEDVVDAETVSKEDLLRFYLYINKLPKDSPDALFLIRNRTRYPEVYNTHSAHKPLALDLSGLFI
ncbi:hypothetical protein TSUD_326270 [Trifolium subterraneum]|uniref:RING-type domain-containing protein n=1 Tax=Trifolium subterraneum TaxID=3900 RepID=A0A2Z6M4C8_TRISU|nr:hypothetical protein TSUD_326270 [Trifolium subterraneum]